MSDFICGPGNGAGTKCEKCGHHYHVSVHAECPTCRMDRYNAAPAPAPQTVPQAEQAWIWKAVNEIWMTTYARHDERQKLYNIIAKHAAGQGGARVVIGETVVSKPGAAIEVRQLHLSEAAKAGLDVSGPTPCDACGGSGWSAEAARTETPS